MLHKIVLSGFVAIALSGCLQTLSSNPAQKISATPVPKMSAAPVAGAGKGENLNGIWKHNQSGALIEIRHDGNRVEGFLVNDFQTPGNPKVPAGSLDISLTLHGNQLDGTGLLSNPHRAIDSCKLPATERSEIVLTYNKDLEILNGKLRNYKIDLGSCNRTSFLDLISYSRLLNKKYCPYALELRPSDSFASDCTPGRLLLPGSPRHAQVLGALEVVQESRPSRIFDAQNKNQYLIFIATDGTGNHREQFVPNYSDEPTRYSADQCVASVLKNQEGISNLTYTTPPTNPLLLYNQVLIEKRDRVVPIYIRGVGTEPKGGFISEYVYQAGLLYDLKRQVDDAYRAAQESVATIYKWNKNAEIVFVTTGFSRGAAAARILNNRMLKDGFRDPDNPKEYLLRPENLNLGATILYDTVISIPDIPIPTQIAVLGLPKSLAIPNNLQGLHITAENEYRLYFPLTPAKGPFMLNISIPGAHSDIGGTYTTDGISAVTLKMGMIYLNKIGIPVGNPAQGFGLKDSYKPNPKKFVIHDSRWCPTLPPFENLTFDQLLNSYGRPLD
jgi:Uncharacterized alpha/beta hydrolase domain (DUF2235)